MMKTRILSFLLAMIMVLLLLPVSVFAADSTASETTEATQTTEATEGTPEVVSQQLSLGDDLTMLFYVAAEANTVVNVTVNGETSEHDLSTMDPDSNGQYVIAVELAAAQMTEEITLDFLRNDVSVLQKTYSVREYAVTILEGDYSARTKKMVKAMLHYGTAAQQYFGVNTDSLANAGYEMAASEISGEYEALSVSGSLEGVSFYGASLVFASKIAVRYYFKAESTEGVTFTANGETYEAVEKNGLYCVEVSGINPQDYDKSISVAAAKGDETLNVSYSPMNYIVRMSQKSENSTLKALLSALYSYHKTAVEYVTETSFFGDSQGKVTTSNVDLSADTGANTGTVTVSEDGLAYAYADSFYGSDFYFETKIHVNSVLAGEYYPKFGLFVEDAGVRESFYVDMKTNKTANSVGIVSATEEAYDWTNAESVAVSGMRFDGDGEYVTLGLLKVGKNLHFFVDGEYVLSCESDFTGNVCAGVFGFNTGMELKEYYTDISEETLKTLQDSLLVNYEAMTDIELRNISLEKLQLAVNNGASTAISTWQAEYTDGGVKIFVNVEDEISIDENYIGMSDNVEFQIQAVHNYLQADGYTLNMLCNGEGKYWLRRWSAASGWVTEEVSADITSANDSVYYLFETTDRGYQVEFFISYDMLRVTEEEAKNNVRIFPMLRNRTDSAHNVYAALDLYGSQYNYPSTWFVLDESNCFTRTDMEPFYLKDVSAESEQMLSNLAEITSNYTMYATEMGAPAFSNSIWGFDGLARDLYGTDYVRGPKGGGETITVKQAGYVIVLCSGTNSTMRETLNADGWTLLADKASNALALAASSDHNFQYLCSYYGKYFEAGETFTVSGEYAVVFAKAAEALGQFPWKTTPAYISFDAVNDPYYSEALNTFNACPSIAVTNGGRLIATYVTGGTAEPASENSVVFAYSDDGGETWTNAFVLDSWVNQKVGGTKESIVLEADLRVDPATNKLYVVYNLRMDRDGYIVTNSGVWLFSVDNPDADVSDWQFSEQTETGLVYVRNTFTILSDGRFAIIPNGYMSSEPNYIYFSSDEGKTWTKGGGIYVPQAFNFDEPVLVEKQDGTLWALFRTTLGAVYESFSYDGGETWTVGQKSQINNPCSRFNITRLASGNLIMVYNNTSSGRLGMVVALSEDDGKTWTNKLCAFDGYASYPAIALEYDNGEETIHIIFDDGRYYNTQWQSSEDGSEQYYAQIYHYAFTEEELLAGGDPNAQEVELLAVGDSYTHPNWWTGFYNSLGIYGAETIGIGGTKVEEWNNDTKLAEVITKAPQRLFINLGINDIGAGTDGETVGTDLVAYLQALQTALPEMEIYYNLMVYPPDTAFSYDDIDIANTIVKAYIEADISGKLHCIDIRDKLIVDGTVDASKFLSDGVHLSATGYAILTEAIKEATCIGVPVSDLNLIRRTTKTVCYDFDSVEFVDLGTVGGTNTNAFNAYIAEKDGNLYFKAETTAALDASLDEGVDFFVHFGDQTYTARTENTYCFNLYTCNGAATGNIYNYPNAAKSAALGIANVYRKVVVQDGVTTLYGVLPIESLRDVDASKISVSLTAVKGSGFDTWTYKAQTVDRFKPLYYVALHSDNTISKDLTAAEFEKLMSAASVYQEDKSILENMAVISTTGIMQVIDKGDCLFSDRLTQNYTFDANLPDFMFGMDYAYNKITEGNFTVETAGYVIVIVPGGSAYTSIRTKFENAGFAKILSDWNKMSSLTDPLNYYVKWCEAGESYSYGKWNVAVAEQ